MQDCHAVAVNNRDQALSAWQDLVQNPDTGDHWEGRSYLSSGGRQIRLQGEDCVAAEALNDRGEVVGSTKIAVGFGSAFLWRREKMKILTVGDTGLNIAHSINNRGDVVGEMGGQPFLYRRGALHILKEPKGSSNGTALGINQLGQIAGSVGVITNTVDTGQHKQSFHTEACLWTHGQPHLLGRVPGEMNSEAHALNNRGQVVGMSGTRPFLWQRGNMIDLNQLIPKSAKLMLEDVSSINDRGQIVVEAQQGGERHRFLLTPLPRRLNSHSTLVRR